MGTRATVHRRARLLLGPHVAALPDALPRDRPRTPIR